MCLPGANFAEQGASFLLSSIIALFALFAIGVHRLSSGTAQPCRLQYKCLCVRHRSTLSHVAIGFSLFRHALIASRAGARVCACVCVHAHAAQVSIAKAYAHIYTNIRTFAQRISTYLDKKSLAPWCTTRGKRL